MKNKTKIWQVVIFKYRDEYCPYCGGKSKPRFILHDDNNGFSILDKNNYCEKNHYFYKELEKKINKSFYDLYNQNM